jgi:hypothetical protein
MQLRFLSILLAILYVGTHQIAYSAPIVFEHWGVGTGWIGTIHFSNYQFKVTATGDTNNRIFIPNPAPDPSMPDGDIYSIDHDSASIAIDGIGEFALTSATRTFYSSTVVAVGWGREGVQGDIFDGPFNLPALQSWDMTTSLAEVSGIGVVIESLGSPAVMTTGGQLMLSGEYGVAARFRATVIPEPNSWTLMAMLGIACMAWQARCRR